MFILSSKYIAGKFSKIRPQEEFPDINKIIVDSV